MEPNSSNSWRDKLVSSIVNRVPTVTTKSDVENATSTPEARDPFVLTYNEYTVAINGYVTPVLVLLTLVLNFCVCAVLVKPAMRSATNVLLVAMAISDTLTGIWPLPSNFYFYVGGHHEEWVPYKWCFAYFCLTDYLPTIFHTASVWLTMTLAAQRYISVCHSVRAMSLCSVNNALKAVAMIYVVTIASQLCRFLEADFVPIVVPSRTGML